MEDNSNFSHNIYKNNPLLFKSYIDMEVNILTEHNSKISGIVYTVDPVSESVVLLHGPELNNLKIVFGYAIKNIEIISQEPCCKLSELFTNSPPINHSTLVDRRNHIIKLLQENRFLVTENDNILTVENVLSIKPPYEAADCICANSIILGRIQDILSHAKS